MYSIVIKKNKYKLTDKDELKELDGFLFGRKTHKINGVTINNLIIHNKKITHKIVKIQVDKKYNKLIVLLTELLVSDDDSGSGIREALNEIEKFRQIIKNKYREYLTKKELEVMSNKLTMIKKEANKRLIEMENYFLDEELSKGSHK